MPRHPAIAALLLSLIALLDASFGAYGFRLTSGVSRGAGRTIDNVLKTPVIRGSAALPTMGDSDGVHDDATAGAETDADTPTQSEGLTNLVMTVEYDGGEYSGFVGPMHFFNVLRREVENAQEGNTRPRYVPPKERSVSNEILRILAVIHGYIPNGRKRRKTKAAQQAGPTSDCDEPGGEEDAGEAELTLPLERRFTLISASRTDKGVHATETACQYISFDREPPFYGDIDYILDNLNRLLPDDIRVNAMIQAPRPDFNVRFDNLGKIYTYQVDLSATPNLFERRYYWQIASDRQFRNTLLKRFNDMRQDFSYDRMRAAAAVMVGTHNFEGLRKKSHGNEKFVLRNPICTIESIDVVRLGAAENENKCHVVIKGDRFLYKMVRGMVSHMVLVGYGVLKVEDIERMLQQGTPIPHIEYAPSVGLYLSKVIFEPEIERELAASKERRLQRRRKLMNKEVGSPPHSSAQGQETENVLR